MLFMITSFVMMICCCGWRAYDSGCRGFTLDVEVVEGDGDEGGQGRLRMKWTSSDGPRTWQLLREESGQARQVRVDASECTRAVSCERTRAVTCERSRAVSCERTRAVSCERTRVVSFERTRVVPKLLIDFGTRPKITNRYWDFIPTITNRYWDFSSKITNRY